MGQNLKDSKMQNETKQLLTQYMKSQLKDDELIDALVPEFGVGCRYKNSMRKLYTLHSHIKSGDLHPDSDIWRH